MLSIVVLVLFAAPPQSTLPPRIRPPQSTLPAKVEQPAPVLVTQPVIQAAPQCQIINGQMVCPLPQPRVTTIYRRR